MLLSFTLSTCISLPASSIMSRDHPPYLVLVLYSSIPYFFPPSSRLHTKHHTVLCNTISLLIFFYPRFAQGIIREIYGCRAEGTLIIKKFNSTASIASPNRLDYRVCGLHSTTTTAHPLAGLVLKRMPDRGGLWSPIEVSASEGVPNEKQSPTNPNSVRSSGT